MIDSYFNNVTKRPSISTIDMCVYEVHWGPVIRPPDNEYVLVNRPWPRPDNGTPLYSLSGLNGRITSTQGPNYLLAIRPIFPAILHLDRIMRSTNLAPFILIIRPFRPDNED